MEWIPGRFLSKSDKTETSVFVRSRSAGTWYMWRSLGVALPEEGR